MFSCSFAKSNPREIFQNSWLAKLNPKAEDFAIFSLAKINSIKAIYIKAIYLEKKSSNNDYTEQFVGHKIVEDVTFTVYFTRVDLVKDLHQDKRVEHNG